MAHQSDDFGRGAFADLWSRSMAALVALLIKYNDDQKANMVAAPSDRAKNSASAVAHFGGRAVATYGTFGEYDMLYIYEMPDHFSVAANLHLVDGFGAAKYSKVIPLFTADEFLQTQVAAHNATHSYSSVPKPE
jgi:uncharacterized protein with GYD domain